MSGQEVDESAVKKALNDFLQSRVKVFDQQDIDDIVLSYVVGLLQDLVAGEDDDFDAEGFCEMMAAYLPQTETIPADDISEWMLNLVRNQRILKMKNQGSGLNFDLKSVIEETTNKANNPPAKAGCRSKNNSESSSSSFGEKKRILSEASSDEEEFQVLVGQLLEMFPYACDLEVSHCLTLMNCDVERASQLIMHRYESGQSLQPNVKKVRRDLE